MEEDGIKIDISKREDITSVGSVCITDYDSWPSDQNPHGRRAAVRSTRDHRARKVLWDKEDASSLPPLKCISTHTVLKGLVKPKPPGPTHRAACFSNALVFTAAIEVRTMKNVNSGSLLHYYFPCVTVLSIRQDLKTN